MQHSDDEVEVSIGARTFSVDVSWAVDNRPDVSELLFEVEKIQEFSGKNDDLADPSPALSADEVKMVHDKTRERWDEMMEARAERHYERRMDR